MRRGDPPTAQELKALRAVGRYGTMAAAARELGLSPHTIDAHLDRLRRKTGFRHLPQLFLWAAEHGLLLDTAPSVPPVRNGPNSEEAPPRGQD